MVLTSWVNGICEKAFARNELYLSGGVCACPPQCIKKAIILQKKENNGSSDRFNCRDISIENENPSLNYDDWHVRLKGLHIAKCYVFFSSTSLIMYYDDYSQLLKIEWEGGI